MRMQGFINSKILQCNGIVYVNERTRFDSIRFDSRHKIAIISIQATKTYVTDSILPESNRLGNTSGVTSCKVSVGNGAGHGCVNAGTVVVTVVTASAADRHCFDLAG